MPTICRFDEISIKMNKDGVAQRWEVGMNDPYYYESVTEAIPCGGYKVAVRFRKGACGVFDCTRYLDDPFWASLKDKSVFDKVRVDCGTLTWPGDIDIAPEEVWADAVRVTE